MMAEDTCVTLAQNKKHGGVGLGRHRKPKFGIFQTDLVYLSHSDVYLYLEYY
jgi:hypothetical protein